MMYLVDTERERERETMAATGGQVSSKVAEASGGDAPLTDRTNERTNEHTHDPRLLFLGGRETDHGRTYARTDEQTTDALSRGAASHWRLLAAPLPTSWLILDGVVWCVPLPLPRPSRSSLALSVSVLPLSPPIASPRLSLSH